METKHRVIWITLGGSWVTPLLYQLKDDFDIMVIIPTSAKSETKIVDNITFVNVHMSPDRYMCSMSDSIAKKYIDIIDKFHPDLIHVHGTEHNFGQIYRYCHKMPIVVSIQGILTESYPVSTNGLTCADIASFRTLKNFLGRGGLYSMEKRWKKGSEDYELDIVKNNHYFFCRTRWDKEFIKNHNQKAYIMQGEELLRPAFYTHAGKWSLDKCVSHRIFTTAGFNPIKGLHHAIRVLAEIKKQWPDVSMVIPGTQMHVFAYRGLKQRIIGEEYVGYCNHLIDQLEVRDNIIFLPYLDDDGMAEQLLKANVFLSATSIDNSPNALGEAMMIGLPCVTTPVGGVSSIIDNGENGLLATTELLFENVSSIFRNPELAKRLSKGAYSTALLRHDRNSVKQQYLEAYKTVISDFCL